ncbi:hypothetical protein CsSME_00019080 [Camellia sinensis var. sinensis]
MAGHFPHGGGPPGTGDDPDIMALPPRVRPFIPERYAPRAHILPRATFYHFTDFDDRAPGDLLLREIESHLSHEAREVSSRVTRRYGSIVVRDWYAELPEAIRDWVDLAGFGPFCAGISRFPASTTLIGALVERWWDSTNSIHFSSAGDMTMTPFDFVVLTGLDVGGWAIPYDEDMGQWEATWIYLLGARPLVDRSSGRVRYTWFSSHFRHTEPETLEEITQYACGFLMFLFGITLFFDRGNTVGLYLLGALADLTQVSRYDWGGASLATLYCYMSVTSRGRGNIIGGYWRAWEVLSALLIYISAFQFMGFRIFSHTSARAGGGGAPCDPLLACFRGPVPAAASRDSSLPTAVLRHGAAVRGNPKLPIPNVFIFGLFRTSTISDQSMHWLSADYLAALVAFGWGPSISVCRRMGLFPV